MNVFAPAPSAPLTSAFAGSLGPGTQVTLLNAGFRTSYASQWNLALLQNVGRNDLVAFTYLGSSAHRLPNVVDMGQCRPTPDLYCDPGTRPWPRYGLMLYQDGAGNSSNQAFIAK